ncbi:MAG: type II CRISPR-associated endonuclease Cas1 [Mycoplasmataceae bacterium]|nr:type II CRISPR-associated endonuclease Cas1 [Mycoplasmataceae bacterium]
MGWKIIEIETAERLKLFIGNLLIFKNDQKYTIPLNDIDVLLLDNLYVTLSQQLIAELSLRNILVICCDKKHVPCALILPISGNYNSLKILQKQFKWTEAQKGEYWQKNISLKIFQQATLLKYFQFTNESKILISYANEVLFYDKSNREGHASKLYWSTLFGNKFSRDDELNPINHLLNFGYAILLSYVAKSCVKFGLDMRVAVFHKSFSNHFALATDLMEIFRTIVDCCIYKIINKSNIKMLSPDIKRNLIELFTKQVNIDAQKVYISRAIDLYVTNFLLFKILIIQCNYDEY